MKRFVSLILILTFALALAACGARRGTGARPPENESGEAFSGAEGDGNSVGGHTVRLTKNLDHGALHFKAPENAEIAGYDQALNLYCRADGELLCVISLVYFEGKTEDEAMGSYADRLTEKTAGGLVCRFLELEEETDGAKTRTYVYGFNGTAYTVSFTSAFDTGALEEAFFANVRFE